MKLHWVTRKSGLSTVVGEWVEGQMGAHGSIYLFSNSLNVVCKQHIYGPKLIRHKVHFCIVWRLYSVLCYHETHLMDTSSNLQTTRLQPKARKSFVCHLNSLPAAHLNRTSRNPLYISRVEPKTRTRAFSVATPIVWNSLPASVKSEGNIVSFRRRLKTYLFNAAYPP